MYEDATNVGSTPHRGYSYVFGYNGDLYIVEGGYFLANATDFVMKQLEDAFASFKFN